MAVTMVTVVHTMTLIGETAPQDITVEVRPAARVWVPGETSSYLPRNIDVDVANDGTYTFEVPAVDDTALVGSNVTYQVIERTVPGPRGRQPPLQTVHRIAPTLAQAPGPVGLFDTLVDVPVPGGAEGFVDRVVDQAVDQLGTQFAPVQHTHTLADLPGITVDTSVGTRVMVGGVLVHGDTGVRDMAGELLNGWTAEAVSLSRVGDLVTIDIRGANATNATTSVMFNLPTEFRPPGHIPMPAYMHPTTPIFGRVMSVGVAQIENGTSPSNARYAQVVYRVDRPWPSSLPGVPA